MNKIAHISVRDNRKIDFTKKPNKAFSFFNIFSHVARIFELISRALKMHSPSEICFAQQNVTLTTVQVGFKPNITDF